MALNYPNTAAFNPAEEYKEVCPYDKIHRIVPERFQKHLIQCRRMHPDEPLDTCPFDSTHIFGACERSYHLKNCDAVKTRLHEMVKEKNSETHFKAPPIDLAPIEQSENWDDINVKTYDPSEYLAQSDVMRLAQNMIPSERKNFRANERRRLAALKQNGQAPAIDRATPIGDLRKPHSVADAKLYAMRKPASDSGANFTTTDFDTSDQESISVRSVVSTSGYSVKDLSGRSVVSTSGYSVKDQESISGRSVVSTSGYSVKSNSSAPANVEKEEYLAKKFEEWTTIGNKENKKSGRGRKKN